MKTFLAAPIDPREVAFLLDVDGSILDLAPTPREVFVSVELRQTLQRLQEHSGGALALVSGRPLKELDLLFAPLQLAAVGNHGAEMRPIPNGAVHHKGAPPLEKELKRRLATIASLGPGIILEDKEYSLAIHYRLAPEKENVVRDAVLRICEGFAASSAEVLPGKFVLEVKTAGFDKGTAVRWLMKRKPFAGRRPIFVGDDTTDEAAFAVLPEFDGVGISVGRRIENAAICFETPHEVRMWLEQISYVEQAAAE